MKKINYGGHGGPTSMNSPPSGMSNPVKTETPRSKQRTDIRQKRLQYFDSVQQSSSERSSTVVLENENGNLTKLNPEARLGIERDVYPSLMSDDRMFSRSVLKSNDSVMFPSCTQSNNFRHRNDNSWYSNSVKSIVDEGEGDILSSSSDTHYADRKSARTTLPSVSSLCSIDYSGTVGRAHADGNPYDRKRLAKAENQPPPSISFSNNRDNVSYDSEKWQFESFMGSDNFNQDIMREIDDISDDSDSSDIGRSLKNGEDMNGCSHYSVERGSKSPRGNYSASSTNSTLAEEARLQLSQSRYEQSPTLQAIVRTECSLPGDEQLQLVASSLPVESLAYSSPGIGARETANGVTNASVYTNGDTDGKKVPISLSNLESVLGKARVERLLKNLREIEQVSDGGAANDKRESTTGNPSNKYADVKRIPSCSLMILNSEVPDNAVNANYNVNQLPVPDVVSESAASIALDGSVQCSFKVDEIYAEARRVARSNKNCVPSNVKPSWLLLADSFEDKENSVTTNSKKDAAVQDKPSRAIVGEAISTQEVSHGEEGNVVDKSVSKLSKKRDATMPSAQVLNASRQNVESFRSSSTSSDYDVPDNPASTFLNSMQQQRPPTGHISARDSIENNSQPINGDHPADEDHPYLEDSIDRYFRSLETSDGVSNHVTYDPVASFPPTSDVPTKPRFNKSHKKTAEVNGSESNNKSHSRVDEITRSLLKSIDNNDDELFSRLASSFAAEEGKRPLEFVSVRDSEDFVYDHPVGNGRSALANIPESLKNELCVDLGESANSVVMRQRKDAMQVPRVGDSMTFMYADIEHPMDSLPEALKQQLKLDLRDSRDSLVLEPKKSTNLKPMTVAKRVKFPPPSIGVQTKSPDKKSKTVIVNGFEDATGRVRGSDEPELSKMFAMHGEAVLHDSVDKSAIVVDESSPKSEGQGVQFKTADFLKYKRERRSVEFKKSAEDGDALTTTKAGTKPRPRSAVLLSGNASALSKQQQQQQQQQQNLSESTHRRSRSSMLENGADNAVSDKTEHATRGYSPVRNAYGPGSPDRRDNSPVRSIPVLSQSVNFAGNRGVTRDSRHSRHVSADEFGKYLAMGSGITGRLYKRQLLTAVNRPPDQTSYLPTVTTGRVLSSWMSPRISAGELSLLVCLPDEIILTIFEFLYLGDVAKCALVCKRFYRIAMDPTLWKRIVVRKRNLSDASMSKIGQHEPVSLELIQCRGNGLSADGVRDLFRQCSESLQELNITGCKNGQLTGDTLLLHASSRCRHISHLDASWTNVGPQAVIAFSDSCNRLVSVSINGCQLVSDEAIQSLVLKHGSSLNTLELFGLFNLSHVAVFAIGKCCPNLVTLNVGQCWKLSDGSIAQLSARIPTIENLDIRGCKQVNDHTVHQIVQNCTRLRTLSLANCAAVTDSSVAEISARSPQLRSLDLCGCNKVSNVGVKSLATGCQLLEYLDISSTGINHRAVTALASDCRKNLQVLKINFCKQISLDCLVRLARNCKRLNKLFIYGVTSIRSTDEIMLTNPNIWIEK